MPLIVLTAVVIFYRATRQLLLQHRITDSSAEQGGEEDGSLLAPGRGVCVCVCSVHYDRLTT